MSGKKRSRVAPLYIPTNKSDDLIKELEEKWSLLEQSDNSDDMIMMYYLKRHQDKLIPVIENFGKKSVIELLGKLGMWMSDNDIVSFGETIKVDDGHRGRRPNIYR